MPRKHWTRCRNRRPAATAQPRSSFSLFTHAARRDVTRRVSEFKTRLKIEPRDVSRRRSRLNLIVAIVIVDPIDTRINVEHRRVPLHRARRNLNPRASIFAPDSPDLYLRSRTRRPFSTKGENGKEMTAEREEGSRRGRETLRRGFRKSGTAPIFQKQNGD